MAKSQATIEYQRANSLFAVVSSQGNKRVTEQSLRAIGDQDINDAIEAAMREPYVPKAIFFRPRFA